MRTYLLPLALLAVAATAMGQLNITQLGHLDYQAFRNSNLSNLWGYTDEEGNEYALVGVDGQSGVSGSGGLSVVNINDPANPVEVFFAPGPPSIWREIKVWNDHAYVTTEAQGGLQIVDLSPLPQSNVLPVTTFFGNGWITSHSLFIDEHGRLYVNGSNRGNGGSIMYDLTGDPNVPVEVGSFDTWYVHDCFARGDTLYAAHINNGFFSIVDVSDPAAPVLLGTQLTPNHFTHNCWLDDTGHHLFTTDERPDSYLAAYDVSDPTDIQFEDELQTDPGSMAIIHNTYWLDHYVVQSYYTEGVSIYDVTHPDNIVEVGRFDTSPFSGGTFNGAWGVYPFLPSGRLIVSDIEGGLYILQPTYVRACWLQGAITDVGTSMPVNAATVSITGTTATDLTTFDGLYSTGWEAPGTYTVTVSAPGYFPATVPGVVLNTGEVTVQDVQLTSMQHFAFSGTVVESGTSTPVEGATVELYNPQFDQTTTSDAGGHFTFPQVYDGTYEVAAGLWGYHTACANSLALTSGSPDLTLALPVGYADDYAVDLGWTVQSSATTGIWERGEPLGTIYQFAPCAPDSDIQGDCLDRAYVTGNQGLNSSDDDVDDGATTLLSPVFDLSGMADPWVRYDRWWFDGAGSGSPNDSLVIAITDGVNTGVLEVISGNAPPQHSWVPSQHAIADVITPGPGMRLVVRAVDAPPGHIVEAGIDDFEILPNSPFLGVSAAGDAGWSIGPNPSQGRITITVQGAPIDALEVFDAQGRLLHRERGVNATTRVIDLGPSPGVYLVRCHCADGTLRQQRVVID